MRVCARRRRRHRPGTPVYVLDAWRRGEADIYPMHAWLTLPIIVRSPAQIKPLPVPPVSSRPSGA